MLKVGDKAPLFDLPDDSGKTVSLGDFKGKQVILYFYPKDDTPGCTQEACDFRDNHRKFSKLGAVIIGISPDSPARHGKFKEKYGLPFMLVSDESKKTLEAYGVWKKKKNYGREYMGVERTTFVIGKTGKIEQLYPKVKVAGHIESILESLGG